MDEIVSSANMSFDSLVGNATLAEVLAAQGFPTAEAAFAQLFGKNIVFHHGVLWPAIAEAGLGLAVPMRAGVRGFATSDTDWADAREGDPALRLYALTKVPDDGSDFRLIELEFATLRRKIWRNKIGNLMHRLALREAGPAGEPPLPSPEPGPGPAPVPVPEAWARETRATAEAIARHADALAARGIAEAVLAHLRAAGRFAVETSLLWPDAPTDRARAGLIRRQCLALLGLPAPGAGASPPRAPGPRSEARGRTAGENGRGPRGDGRRGARLREIERSARDGQQYPTPPDRGVILR